MTSHDHSYFLIDRMRSTLIVSLLLSLLAVVFALLNNEDVVVNFGFASTRGPLALILILTFVGGVFAGLFAMLPARIRSRKKVKSLEKRLDITPAPADEAEPVPGEDTATGSPVDLFSPRNP